MLYDTIWEIRQAYLKLGFNETVNPLFVDEEDIYKQFGPEAPAVLDRCFFLAGLPRPDIGIGMDKIQVIELSTEKLESFTFPQPYADDYEHNHLVPIVELRDVCF